MGKRLMTLSDLYNYYSTQGKTQRFSSKNDGDTIVVQIDGKLNFSKTDSMDGLYPTRVQMNFVGDNLNGSRIQMKAQEAALPSSHYRPLLACIHDVDGEPQFYGHNMHQEDGEIVYDEQPVGVIAEEAHIEHDNEYDMDYAVALGYIWEEYSKAAYIIDRDQKCDVSVELSIRSLSYDAKDGVLILDDFYYSGCTILGYDENGKKVNPAMPGSNITLADFSVNKNTVYSDKLSEAFDRLEKLIAELENKTTGKEETMLQNELENMEVTEEEIETSEEIVDAATEEEEVTEVEETTETEETPDDVVDEEIPSDDSIKCSVSIGEKIKEFSVSMNAKIEALSQLVNDTYSDDMTWYCIEAYDEDKTVVMIDCWTGKAYRQSYKVKDDVFSLKGDRVEVYSTWMTIDEQKAFENMKSNYSIIEEKLAKYEAEPAKMEVLESDEYSQIAETEEFVALKGRDAHFDLSVDEVRAKADEMLLSYAKHTKLEFASEEVAAEVTVKKLPTITKKTSRYGTLFSK